MLKRRQEVKSEPAPYVPRPDEILEQEIARSFELLEGCAIPRRLKMLILPILQEYDIPWSVLAGASRKADLLEPRRKIWTELNNEGISSAQIGRWFNRDHTTILYGLGKIPSRMKQAFAS